MSETASPLIIGIAGHAGAGKDAAADYLVSRYAFIKLPFATYLKSACMQAFGFTHEQVYGDAKDATDPRWGFTPRWALQHVGTDLFRNRIRDDFWILRTFREIDSRPWTRLWVIPDVRLPNELEAIRARGGKVWRVERSTPSRAQGIEGHVTETALDDYDGWDAVLQNKHNIAYLWSQVDGLMREMGVRCVATPGPTSM